jgi:hypothetical protein
MTSMQTELDDVFAEAARSGLHPPGDEALGTAAAGEAASRVARVHLEDDRPNCRKALTFAGDCSGLRGDMISATHDLEHAYEEAARSGLYTAEQLERMRQMDIRPSTHPIRSSDQLVKKRPAWLAFVLRQFS